MTGFVHTHCFRYEGHDRYLTQRKNCAGALGHSPYQKIITTLRMIAYGVAADYIDEYLQIGESTIVQALKSFVIAVFGPDYLRAPNE